MHKPLARLGGALAGMVAFVFVAACSTSPRDRPATQRWVFRSVTVIPMDRPGAIANQDVVISVNRIVAMGATGSFALRPSDRVIEGQGKFLMLGLWDMHVHAMRPTDQDALRSAFALYLFYGIVGVRDMGSTLSELQALRSEIANDRSLPDFVASGPLLDGPKRPWQPDVALALADTEAVHRAVDQLVQTKVNFLKPYDGLTPEQYQAVIDEGKRVGLPVAGHIPKSMTLEEVSSAGQKSIEHITLKLIAECAAHGEKAMAQMLASWLKEGYGGKYREIHEWFSGRDPAQCQALYERVAQHGVFVTPTLSQEFVGGEYTSPEDLADMSPLAVAACEHQVKLMSSATPELRTAALDDLMQVVKDLHRAGVSLLAGTDASNGCVPHGRSLHKELRLLREAGLTSQEALESATLNPAQFLGRPDEGIVRVGAVANLLLLNGDPLADLTNTLRIGGVMRNGHWSDRAKLDAGRASAIAAFGSPISPSTPGSEASRR